MLKTILSAALIATAAAGCAGEAAKPGSGRFEIAVTDTGFAPSTITIPAGRPATLVVTRKSDQICATEIVFPDLKIRKPLPLNQAVEIALPASRPGEIAYACGMDMYSGKVVVR